MKLLSIEKHSGAIIFGIDWKYPTGIMIHLFKWCFLFERKPKGVGQ